jgi:hypothetical protein
MTDIVAAAAPLTAAGPRPDVDVLEAAIVKAADALRIAIAIHRLEREPGPVNVRYYFECAMQREALARQLSDARGSVKAIPTRGSAALQLLDDALLDMARATTTSTPEQPFQTDV